MSKLYINGNGLLHFILYLITPDKGVIGSRFSRREVECLFMSDRDSFLIHELCAERVKVLRFSTVVFPVTNTLTVLL